MVELKELPAHLDGCFVADSVRITLDDARIQKRISVALDELEVAIQHSGTEIPEFPSTRETTEEIFGASRPSSAASQAQAKQDEAPMREIDFTPPDLSRVGQAPQQPSGGGCCIVS